MNETLNNMCIKKGKPSKLQLAQTGRCRRLTTNTLMSSWISRRFEPMGIRFMTFSEMPCRSAARSRANRSSRSASEVTAHDPGVVVSSQFRR